MVKETYSMLLVPISTEITVPAKKTRVEDRWARSLYSILRDEDEPCTWRRHFRKNSGLAIVFGFLLHQAKKDPARENFAWPSWRAIQANARRLGKKLGRRQIFAILAVLRENDMIERDRRERGGAMRNGFIVHEHDVWSLHFVNAQVCAVRRDFEEVIEKENRAIVRRKQIAEFRKRTVTKNRHAMTVNRQ
jgi:hypothetical protein